MLSSLPDYPRLAETVPQTPRKNHERKTSDRLGRMAFNLAMLVAIWGTLLYARWMIRSDRIPTEELPEADTIPTQSLPEAVLGYWCNAWLADDRRFILFTPHLQLQLIQRRVMIESADYQIVGDVLTISSFTDQPSGRDLEIQPQSYRISIRGDQLTITPLDIGFTPLSEHAQGVKSSLRLSLPWWHGESNHYALIGKR